MKLTNAGEPACPTDRRRADPRSRSAARPRRQPSAATAAAATRATPRSAGANRRRDSPAARASATIVGPQPLPPRLAPARRRGTSAPSTAPHRRRPGRRRGRKPAARTGDRPVGSGCLMWMVVWIGSLAGWRNSTSLRAPRSSSVASAASSVEVPPVDRAGSTTAGGSGPRSCVAGAGRHGPGAGHQQHEAVETRTSRRPRPTQRRRPRRAVGSIADALEPDLDRAALALGGLEELLDPEPTMPAMMLVGKVCDARC